MSTEPEPTMIWLAKDDFSRLKEDLLELFEGDSRKGEQSCFYPQVWTDAICDDGQTVQLKISMAWRKREGFVHLKKRSGRKTYVSPHGNLCGCTVLPTGEQILHFDDGWDGYPVTSLCVIVAGEDDS